MGRLAGASRQTESTDCASRVTKARSVRFATGHVSMPSIRSCKRNTSVEKMVSPEVCSMT
eukprot:67894-Amphidinium_carterae.1